MKEVSQLLAKTLFENGQEIFVLPSMVEFNHPTFRKLSIKKNFFCREFPTDKIRQYQKAYCDEKLGTSIRFYFSPTQVLIGRQGHQGFTIKDFHTKQLLFIVPGKEMSLIRFANARHFEVVNAGYLEPRYREKFRYKYSPVPVVV